ncbi:hypothetical protein LINPERHAP1_LOCUS1394 [Linum perenne]
MKFNYIDEFIPTQPKRWLSKFELAGHGWQLIHSKMLCFTMVSFF